MSEKEMKRDLEIRDEFEKIYGKCTDVVKEEYFKVFAVGFQSGIVCGMSKCQELVAETFRKEQ